MTSIPVTTTFIAIYALVLIPMTGWVGILRGRLGALRGTGDNAVLEKRIRIHGNLTEIAPVLALSMGASEMLGMPAYALWLAFGTFIVGRVMHYYLFDSNAWAMGMLVSQLPVALLSAWCLYSIYLA